MLNKTKKSQYERILFLNEEIDDLKRIVRQQIRDPKRECPAKWKKKVFSPRRKGAGKDLLSQDRHGGSAESIERIDIMEDEESYLESEGEYMPEDLEDDIVDTEVQTEISIPQYITNSPQLSLIFGATYLDQCVDTSELSTWGDGNHNQLDKIATLQECLQDLAQENLKLGESKKKFKKMATLRSVSELNEQNSFSEVSISSFEDESSSLDSETDKEVNEEEIFHKPEITKVIVTTPGNNLFRRVYIYIYITIYLGIYKL